MVNVTNQGDKFLAPMMRPKTVTGEIFVSRYWSL
jgi:hypothetical protein